MATVLARLSTSVRRIGRGEKGGVVEFLMLVALAAVIITLVYTTFVDTAGTYSVVKKIGEIVNKFSSTFESFLPKMAG